ncbi:uncharacterized protein MYCGRDRAFT_104327, partial [Zymoseptoria tritici IPO323]
MRGVSLLDTWLHSFVLVEVSKNSYGRGIELEGLITIDCLAMWNTLYAGSEDLAAADRTANWHIHFKGGIEIGHGSTSILQCHIRTHNVSNAVFASR